MLILILIMFVQILAVARLLWNNLFQSNSPSVSQAEGLWCPSRAEQNFREDSRSRYEALRVRRDSPTYAGCSL